MRNLWANRLFPLLDAAGDRAIGLLERAERWDRGRKRIGVFAVDLVLLIVSIWIAYSLRMGEWSLFSAPIQVIAAGCVSLMVPIFWACGVYNAIFRYAGGGMVRTLLGPFAIYTLAMVAIYFVLRPAGLPRTIAVIQPIVFFSLVVGWRILIRWLVVDLMGRRRFGGDVRNVLVYGAGNAGQQLASSMSTDPEMRLCGYVDDDERLAGQRLNGIRVYWSGELPEVIKRLGVTDVLLAMPSMGRKRRRRVVEHLSGLKVRVKTLPQLKEIVGGRVSVSDIRPVDIEDLLGREPVRPNELLLGRTIVGKSVLVTGAGGSIGSELCRQIARLGARRIVLFELSEFALYSIHGELSEIAAQAGLEDLRIVPLLGSITDRRCVDACFAENAIDTVFHAAAYKHVPLVEANPVAAVRNNVIGTRRLVEAAAAAGVSDFILVSTDKAVRPTNIMGASKRAAEQIVQAFAAMSARTRFSMVRFGNVLGSSGSVVPLFRRQIETGARITLTHRDVTRYFMTIPEAANLVIQAGGLASGGEVFVLDMGKPTRIFDLAHLMVKLSGLSVKDEEHPDGDIEIVEVGLRPGEKLFEELLIGENPQKTKHPRIMRAVEAHLGWQELSRLLDQLQSMDRPAEVIAQLRRIVPELEHRRDDRAA